LKKLLPPDFRISAQQRIYIQDIHFKKKAAHEQAANKLRQNSQNVALLPNDGQHTLSPKTRSGARSNFHKILSKNWERINKPTN
jgi:uncharacterized protein YpiB (UPF0302 family)